MKGQELKTQVIENLKNKGYQDFQLKQLDPIIQATIEATKQALKIPVVSDNNDYQEPIDIYAEEGTKVKYTGKNGYDSDKEHANKYLKVGEIYTIDYMIVNGWNTEIYLKEMPNEVFNSVHFVKAD